MVRPQWQFIHSGNPASVEDVMEILMKNRSVGLPSLDCSLQDLEAYLTICGMDEAAELMARHLFDGHRITLAGDYDCDGVTSVAQMAIFLKEIGYTNFDVVLPLRAEGYGIPDRVVHGSSHTKLLVAMDCGTLEVRQISALRDRGVDCIVIDHHEVSDGELAPANVIVNPKQPGCLSVFKEFCASGLTLLFLTRLRRAIQGRFPAPNLGGRYLILATIGTVADLVPLVEGNRVLAKTGIELINNGNYAALKQLLQTAGLGGKRITAGHVGYYLGPRINAAGRMSDARIAFDLLTSEEPAEMDVLAQELNRLNLQRQQEEDAILSQIRRRCMDLEPGRRTVVVADPGWRAGLIGIVASRIQQELHYGPSIVFSMDLEKGTARGSARSIPGFDIHAALKECGRLLLKWGGHKMAAGMTISLDKLEAFAQLFEDVARNRSAEVFVPKGKIDTELSIRLVSTELYGALRRLEPHGLGNPTPTFAARKVKVCVQKAFGREHNHLRLSLAGGPSAVYWRGGRHFESIRCSSGQPLDVVFQLEWDSYSKRPVLNVKDLGDLF